MTPNAQRTIPAKRVAPPAALAGAPAAARPAPGRRPPASLFHQPTIVVLGRDDRGKPHASWFDEAQQIAARRAATLMGMQALPVSDDAVRGLAARLPQGRVFESGKAFVPFVKGDLYDELVAHLPDGGEPSEAASAGSATETSGAPVTASVGAAAGKRGKGAKGTKAGTDPRKAAGVPASPSDDEAGGADGDGQGDDEHDGNDDEGGGGGGSGGDGPDGAEIREGHRPTDWTDIALGSVVLATEGPQEGWFESVVVELRDDNIFLVRWRDWPDEPHFARHRNQLGLLPSGRLTR